MTQTEIAQIAYKRLIVHPKEDRSALAYGYLAGMITHPMEPTRQEILAAIRGLNRAIAED